MGFESKKKNKGKEKVVYEDREKHLDNLVDMNGKFKKGNPGPPRDSLSRPEKYTKEFIEKEAEALEKWFDEDPKRIWFKDFALERKYDPDLLDDFKDVNDRFMLAYKYAKQKQQSRLVNKGLYNETNAHLTKFVLQNCHNWKEKTEVQGTSQNSIEVVISSIEGKTQELVNDK